VAVFSKISADLQKTVNKIIKKIKRRKGRIIVGLDAHLMNFLYKLFPRLGPAIITRVLKKSGLEIFDKI
jgi:Fe-S oxidoreductase